MCLSTDSNRADWRSWQRARLLYFNQSSRFDKVLQFTDRSVVRAHYQPLFFFFAACLLYYYEGWDYGIKLGWSIEKTRLLISHWWSKYIMNNYELWLLISLHVSSSFFSTSIWLLYHSNYYSIPSHLNLVKTPHPSQTPTVCTPISKTQISW